jgi:hypothetical protein
MGVVIAEASSYNDFSFDVSDDQRAVMACRLSAIELFFAPDKKKTARDFPSTKLTLLLRRLALRVLRPALLVWRLALGVPRLGLSVAALGSFSPVRQRSKDTEVTKLD